MVRFFSGAICLLSMLCPLPGRAEQAPEFTAQYVMNHFPLCRIRSSYGQLCKSFPDDKKNTFTPSRIDGIQSITITENELKITTSDWYYLFRIEKTGKGQFEITFHDDGKHATYLAVTKLRAVWSAANNNWMLDGKTLAAAGNKPTGKYVDSSPDIPFVKR